MALVSWAKKEFARLKLQIPKRISLPRTSTLTPMKGVAASQAKDMELAVDLRCASCQKRIATAISSIGDLESIEVDILVKKIKLTPKSRT